MKNRHHTLEFVCIDSENPTLSGTKGTDRLIKSPCHSERSEESIHDSKQILRLRLRMTITL